MTDVRLEELAGRLDQVRSRMRAACEQAGRGTGEVRLTVVTKFFPAEDVRRLHSLGVRDVGENRHQEAEEKVHDTSDLDLRWHFIGNLQSNKAAAVAAYADVVESVDRPKLVTGLGRGALASEKVLDCLVQVSLDQVESATGRSGASPDDVLGLADRVAATDGLRLRGLMAVAPLGQDPAPAFARLVELASRVREQHPEAVVISAGMSGDLEAAVAAGATHVRIGSAVLGPRPALR